MLRSRGRGEAVLPPVLLRRHLAGVQGQARVRRRHRRARDRAPARVQPRRVRRARHGLVPRQRHDHGGFVRVRRPRERVQRVFPRRVRRGVGGGKVRVSSRGTHVGVRERPGGARGDVRLRRERLRLEGGPVLRRRDVRAEARGVVFRGGGRLRVLRSGDVRRATRRRAPRVPRRRRPHLRVRPRGDVRRRRRAVPAGRVDADGRGVRGRGGGPRRVPPGRVRQPKRVVRRNHVDVFPAPDVLRREIRRGLVPGDVRGARAPRVRRTVVRGGAGAEVLPGLGGVLQRVRHAPDVRRAGGVSVLARGGARRRRDGDARQRDDADGRGFGRARVRVAPEGVRRGAAEKRRRVAVRAAGGRRAQTPGAAEPAEPAEAAGGGGRGGGRGEGGEGRGQGDVALAVAVAVLAARAPRR